MATARPARKPGVPAQAWEDGGWAGLRDRPPSGGDGCMFQ